MTRISLLVLALPLACAFDKQLDPQASDSSESGDGSDGGEATTADDVGDPSATTENSVTTVVPPDDETGTDTTTGGFDAACSTDQAVLVTEIDDIQDGVLWDSLGYYFDQMGVGIEFGAGDGGFQWSGMLLMRTGEPPATGETVQAGGYIREPDNSPAAPSAWYCFDESSTFLDADDEVTVSLEGLRRFGPCPGGEPLEGTITACFGDESCGGQSQLDVALTDIEYVIEVPGSISTGLGAGELMARYSVGNGPAAGAGLLGIHATDIEKGSPGIQVSPLIDVFFISPLDRPDGGAIYCAGEGSTLTYDGASGNEVSASLTNITRLGSCTDDGGDAGVGQFCANFGGV